MAAWPDLQCGDVVYQNLRNKEEKETKWLKVIQKTEHLCIFEGYRSCQWVDVYKYRNGALNCVG